ncbi:hypothetical protein B0813_000316 [Candidatus Fervidibacteria bacterium JGI MDM2 SSWTFF-3-K9]
MGTATGFGLPDEFFCQRYGITVVIPEVALAEARASLLARIDRQLNFLQQLRQWLNDIARAAEMDKLVQSVRQGLNAIEAELRKRRNEVQEAINTFAQACIVVPLTPQVWTKAYVRWKANMPPFKELDCLVTETLLEFLQKRKAKLSLFLTMDAEDFDHPEIHAEFKRHRTKMLFDPYAVIVEFRKFYGVA